MKPRERKENLEIEQSFWSAKGKKCPSWRKKRGPIETPPSVQNPREGPVKVTRGHIPEGKSKNEEEEEAEGAARHLRLREVDSNMSDSFL